jgi:hypothetical protein
LGSGPGKINIKQIKEFAKSCFGGLLFGLMKKKKKKKAKEKELGKKDIAWESGWCQVGDLQGGR